MDTADMRKKKYLGPLVAVLTVVLAYHFLVVDRTVVELQINTSKRTLFKIYWAGKGEPWQEAHSTGTVIRPDRENYSFRMASITGLSRLRIDTSEKPATVTIRSLVFKQWGYAPVKLDSRAQFEKLVPKNDIEELAIHSTGISIKPAGRDPHLVFSLPPPERTRPLWTMVVEYLVAGLAGLVIFLLFAGIGKRYRFVVYCSYLVLGMILAMASLTIRNQHPDEEVHIEAARYYQHHTVPPRVASPEIMNTYTRYGVSRLDSGEIAYFVAGKFGRILEPLGLQDHLTFRFFNVSLFALLCLFAAKRTVFRILMIPLLLSSQIWYIFSYFNSEGLAVFVMMLIAYQMVATDSAWNRLIGPETHHSGVGVVIGLGLLLGVLLLCKLNFYFFGIFLFGYFLWRLLFKKTGFSWSVFKRIAAVVMVALALFGGVRFSQQWVNDFDKANLIYKAREAYADKMFKPSTPLDKKFFLLQMKDRGVSLEHIIKLGRWGEKTFRSSFGEYSYMSVAASFGYYDMVRYTGLGLLLVVLGSLLLGPGRLENLSLFSLTTGCAVGLMAVALYHAWTVDFQAQGRYLLPVVGMVSIFLYHTRKRLKHPLAATGFVLMFLLGLYSFVFVGFAGIEKLTRVMG